MIDIIAWLIVGAIAGWLAGQMTQGGGFGVVGNIIVGLIGAVIGGFLAGALFGVDPMDGAFDLSTLITAVIGAVLLVIIVNAVTGRRAV